jgi:hypothetical protein
MPSPDNGLGMQGMIDLLAEAAHAFRRRNASGMAVGRLHDMLASHPATVTLSEAERFRALLLLRQVATVRHGEDTADEQEYLADWLAARHALRLLRRSPADLALAVGDLHATTTPVFGRTLAEEIAADPTLAARLRVAVEGESGSAAAYLRQVLGTVPPTAAPGRGLFQRLFG